MADVVPALPTGTVTFLFTDIEGSTKLLQRLGAGYAEVLATHQRLLRQAWAAHGGVEVDTQGDSFFVVFPHTLDALAAAAQAQQALATYPWPQGEHVRVRMGLHTGVGTLSEGHYVGMDVHRAARIGAAANGGQVLLSQATYDQVAKELAAQKELGLRDLGKHRLKDLPRREEIYQLILPGLPTDYPPLKTLDAWPGYRADLAAVVFLSAVLLAVVGALLPLLVSVFPRAIGVGAAGVAALILVATLLLRPVRRPLLSQWRDARKPFATVTSALLCLVVVSTTLFVTKPPIFVGPKHVGYDFSYTYHAPTHTGGAVTVGVAALLESIAPPFLNYGLNEREVVPIWDSCVVQLPDLTLRLADGWKADQCTEVPTIPNGDESADYRSTTFHIDPHAVWSDGTPVTADDFLFSARLAADPVINGLDPWDLMHLTAPDSHTVQIHWSVPYADYLTVLGNLYPMPLQVFATGKFAGVYDPKTGAYNAALAQQLWASTAFNTTIPVDNGPFTVQSFVPDSRVVIVKNPRFFSNFFHHPALDQVTLVSTATNFAQGQNTNELSRWQADVIASYRRGELILAEGLDPLAKRQLGGIPPNEVITSPLPAYTELGFNQRSASPNAQANGGASIFDDKSVRQAFIEAFDRCAAVRALLGAVNCADRNLFTDEFVVPPESDYDPSYAQPSYNPADAAALLDRAGYPVVDGTRRFKDRVTPMRLVLVLTPGVSTSLAIAQHLQQDYTTNLHVAVTIVDDLRVWATPQTAPYLTGAFDLGLDYLSNPLDPVGLLSGFDTAHVPTVQNPGAGDNVFGVIDPYLDQQDQKGAVVLDTDQRSLFYRDLQRYYAKQFYSEPVYISANVSLVKPGLCNFKKWPQPGFNLWNMADWYVAPSCPS